MFHSQTPLKSCLALCIGCAMATIPLDGCHRERDLERVVVSGAVAYRGKPIPFGRIDFVPVENTSTPSVRANIVDGRYKADLHGGVPVGTYKVQIEAYNKPPEPRDPFWAPINRLPRSCGTVSDIRLTVTSGGAAMFKDFDVERR